MTAVRVLGPLDATFAWDGARLCEPGDFRPGAEPPTDLRGAAATVEAGGDPERWRILRDPLGLDKLFWASEPDGGVVLAGRPWRLVEEGYELGEIAAVPRGLVLDLGPAGSGPVARSLIPEAWARPPEEADVERAGREIRDLLNRYLGALAARHPGVPAFVCLSGGLDSSTVAVLAAEHFPGAVAVSFDLSRRGGKRSEDRVTAARLARDLGLPLLEATVSQDELFLHLDTVLREGIDWRDFNVHAALVNASLASAMADTADRRAGRPIVLTGDLANEFLVDYQPERYRGTTYYRLPRLAPAALRAGLVRGLDTCHREVGIFETWNLSVVQPYAVAVDVYLGLAEGFLRLADRKERLCRAILGGRLPDYVLTRPKARAQVGGADGSGGVLAACVGRGIDAAFLRRRFAELHAVEDERALDRFVRAGRYRARAPSLSWSARESA